MAFTVQYASDLHLEFPANRDFLKRHPLQPKGDLLVLAGDIVPFAQMEKHRDFFTMLGNQFEKVYWLPGNHEYYGYDASKKCGRLQEAIADNVSLVNNISIIHQGVKLIFTTLWSHISPAHEWEIERGMNDFRIIRFGEYRFSAHRLNQMHAESLSFIEKKLKAAHDGQIMVFTHHCPTFLNYPEQYKGDVLNEAFAVELFKLIEPSGIAYWVYGHHHINTHEFSIGTTKLVTNQLGYVQRHEHGLFRTDIVIEI
jgi:predicted MPP superfamily phosphohydrolase